MSPKRARFVVASALAMSVAVSACGVTSESSSHSLDAGAAPTVAPPAGRVTRVTDIFLVRNDLLVSVQRPVPVPVTLAQVVQALFSGPTSGEATQALRSAIPGTVSVHRLTQQDSVVTIDLTGGLAGIDSQEQSLAFAQLVYTVTARAGVAQLRVLVDGQPVEVPRADGTLTNGELNRGDYRALLANR